MNLAWWRAWWPALVVVICGLACGAARAQDDPARRNLADPQERVLAMPIDPAAGLRLVVTLYGPAGAAPLPVAVVLHEANGSPAAQPRLGMNYLASYFLSRGYLVMQPMLRGFAGSGGAQLAQGCDLVGTARANAADIAALLAFIGHAPGVNAQQVVVVGMGFGGWNALAVAHAPPPGVRAVAAFAPAIATSLCPPAVAPPALAQGARDLASGVGLPVLWMRGQGSGDFPPQGPILAAYRAGGAAPDVLDVGNFMGNAAFLFRYPEGVRLWAPRLDALLRRAGLPWQEQSAAYLPVIPPPSGYARIDDVAAIPWLSQAARPAYEAFRRARAPKAFVVAADGQAGFSWGGADPLRAALANCVTSGRFCLPYAYDDDVVWTVPVAAPSHYAAVGDVAKVPYIADHGRADYRSFLAWPLPRAFAVAPQGWTSAQGPQAPASALAQCRARFDGCALYAVDTTVVWRPPE